MSVIYILCDPRVANGDARHVRYVGLSAYDPKDRLLSHIRAKDISYKGNWIRQLQRDGFNPVMIVIEDLGVVSRIELGCAESYWIAQFKAWGFKLTNMTSGGDGIHDLSPESKLVHAKKVSEAKLRLYRDNPNLRKENADRLKAYRDDATNSECIRQKIIDSWEKSSRREKHSAGLDKNGGRSRISESAKKNWATPEIRNRIVNSRLGDKNWKARGVIHKLSGRTFGCIVDAEKWLKETEYPNASGSAIARACKGKLNKVYGSAWEYADGSSVEFIPTDRNGANNKSSRAVICIDTGEFFVSITEAAKKKMPAGRKLDSVLTCIWRVCSGYKMCKSAIGYKWRFATSDEKYLQ